MVAPSCRGVVTWVSRMKARLVHDRWQLAGIVVPSQDLQMTRPDRTGPDRTGP